jgi:predicted lysophospholipase L1 biosynthesis ABC-type transport system permease subunit
MRKQRERQANRVFAMAAVAILAVLLLSDMSLWVILVPVWLVSLLVTQIALQHYATNEKTTGYDRDKFGVLFISRLLRARNIDDEMKNNREHSQPSSEKAELVE